jgi:hypothetical protein
LFTTTPASEITPTPVMMMPNGMRNTISPSSTPTVDMMTDVMMMNGFSTELNCDIRMNPISSSAIRNAMPRNRIDSICSSCWPVYRTL